jgi:hypothetical protein
VQSLETRKIRLQHKYSASSRTPRSGDPGSILIFASQEKQNGFRIPFPMKPGTTPE